ncbi:MAG: NADPH-dependent FMN reductase [Fidelibacterota bacterium]
MHLIISTDLSPNSKTIVLAENALSVFNEMKVEAELIDLAENDLPFCDGKKCFENQSVQELTEIITTADSLIVVSPIYNYDLNAAAKNLLELTGSGWNEKVVGFICKAGGKSSYMSVMPFANSLMLDYRCHIIPRFVYATSDAFHGSELADDEIINRIDELVNTIIE